MAGRRIACSDFSAGKFASAQDAPPLTSTVSLIDRHSPEAGLCASAPVHPVCTLCSTDASSGSINEALVSETCDAFSEL